MSIEDLTLKIDDEHSFVSSFSLSLSLFFSNTAGLGLGGVSLRRPDIVIIILSSRGKRIIFRRDS